MGYLFYRYMCKKVKRNLKGSNITAAIFASPAAKAAAASASFKTSQLPPKAPGPPLAHAEEEGSKVTADLNALLKHVQRSSSL